MNIVVLDSDSHSGLQKKVQDYLTLHIAGHTIISLQIINTGTWFAWILWK